MQIYNIKRLKFLGMLTFLLLTFCIVVSNAYKYLPENNPNKITKEEKHINYSEEKVSIDYSDETLDDSSETQIDSNNDEETISSENKLEILNIDENGNDIHIKEVLDKNSENITTDVFAKAKEYKKKELFVEALAELKHILEQSDSVELKARCYEEMALIYAYEKHYGSALSLAQKAYNMYPTTNGEILLARLYYKTGNTEQANRRIDNVMKRDFWADR